MPDLAFQAVVSILDMKLERLDRRGTSAEVEQRSAVRDILDDTSKLQPTG